MLLLFLVIPWLVGLEGFCQAVEYALHLVVDVRREGQLVAQVDEGYRHLQVLLFKGGEEQLLVEAIGFTYLAFDAVSLDSSFESSFRNADQYRGTAWLFGYGKIDYP